MATLINLLVGILALVLVGAVGTGTYRTVRRRRHDTRNARPLAATQNRSAVGAGSNARGRRWKRLGAQVRSPSVKRALALLSFLIGVLHEGSRGPGYRAVGLRLVDAQTGGKVTLSQKVIRVGSRRAWGVATSCLFPMPKARPLANNEELQSQLKDARREHAGNQTQLQRALMGIYQQHRVEHPFRPALLMLARRLPLLVALDVPALWSPLKQSVPDKLAGTAVVVE